MFVALIGFAVYFALAGTLRASLLVALLVFIARLELEVAIGTLLDRVPTLRAAAPLEDLPLRQAAAVFGLEKLPVRW